jgi:hypothetical protein
MVTKEDIVFRQLITLSDGGRVLLRPLTIEDRQELIELFKNVSPEDLRYMRHNVTDPKLVASWIDELDYDRILPLVAVIDKTWGWLQDDPGIDRYGQTTQHIHGGSPNYQ